MRGEQNQGLTGGGCVPDTKALAFADTKRRHAKGAYGGRYITVAECDSVEWRPNSKRGRNGVAHLQLLRIGTSRRCEDNCCPPKGGRYEGQGKSNDNCKGKIEIAGETRFALLSASRRHEASRR